MRDRIGMVVLGLVAALLVGLVAQRVWRLVSPPARDLRVEATAGALTVAQAFDRRPRAEVVVRGYVVAGGGFPSARLCDGLRTGSPADCLGPYFVLAGLDASRVPVRAADDDDGRRVVWSPEPVALLGTVAADRLTVREIVNTAAPAG